MGWHLTSPDFGNTGTLANLPAAALAIGQVGTALTFNQGASTGILTGPSPLTGNYAGTISVWANLASNTTKECLFEVASSNDGEIFAIFTSWRGAGSISVEFGANRPVYTSSSIISSNVWMHICGTKSPGAIDTTTNIYLNGVKLSVASVISDTPNIPTPTNNSIGYSVADLIGEGDGVYMTGLIDEVRLYNRALDPWEVIELYQAGLAGLRTSKISRPWYAELPALFIPSDVLIGRQQILMM